MVSGFTQVVAVIGHPITQVKSPENFNRYFAGQGQDSVMIPVDIVPEAVADYLNALRGWQNMSGVLVTVPHKQRVASLVDELTPRARHLNAVNVVRKLPDGRYTAILNEARLYPPDEKRAYPRFSTSWVVTEGEYKGRFLYMNFNFNAQGFPYFKQFTNAVGVAVPHLAALPDRLRESQALFEKTGGVHAAGLFTDQQEGFGTQYIVSHTPTQLKNSLTSIIVYSAAGRVARVG